MRTRTIAALAALPLLAPAAAHGADFSERFAFKGERAFTTGAGGQAAFWNSDDWDVRADTYDIAVTPNDESAPWRGHYTAVLKAKSSKHSSGAVKEGSPLSSGGGGVGVMRLDYQGVLSARLRNPMMVTSSRPGTVSFYAPLFATTGHWWEVAITPADQPTAGEYTAVPARQSPEGLNSPVSGKDDDGSTNGPGHRASIEDAVNVISTGFPDAPACFGTGWHARWALTSARAGRVTDHVNPKADLSKLYKLDPKKKDRLVRWKITYTPTKVVLSGDRDGDGKLERVDAWKVDIPWRQVYVNLLYVAYQAGHHPAPNCGYGKYGIVQSQQTAWRDVKVSPVAYSQTTVYPKTAAQARDAGWMFYDLRDLDAHVGAGAPNRERYDKYQSYLACSKDNGGGLPCPNRAKRTLTLKTMIDDGAVSGLRRAQLLADLRYAGGVRVKVNGKDAGAFPRVPKRPDIAENDGFGDAFEVEAWVRRAVDVPTSALGPGLNTIELTLDPDTNVDIDRIQLELARG